MKSRVPFLFTRKMKVLITGVSSGIGWGLSKYYLSIGATVYGISRRVPEDLIKNPNFKHLVLDLSKFDRIDRSISAFVENISTLDLVILNAGVLGEIKDLKNQSILEIKTVMDINVWSNKLVVDTLLKSVESITSIVAISSGAAVNGSRGWGAYSLSKASLNMLIKLYAAENDKTTFYTLAPGLVDTEMQDYLCSGKIDATVFSSTQKLIDARNTDRMPSATVAGELLANAILKIQKLPTGTFSDVRKMA